MELAFFVISCYVVMYCHVTSRPVRPVRDETAVSIHKHMTKDELVDSFGVKSVHEVPEYEITFPVTWNRDRARRSREQTFNQSTRDPKTLSLAVRAFSNDYILDVMENKHVFPPAALLHHWHGAGLSSLRAPRAGLIGCHYSGHVRGLEGRSVVTLSTCQGRLNGLVTTENTDFFVKPLPRRLTGILFPSRLRNASFVHDVDAAGPSESLTALSNHPHVVHRRAARKLCNDVDSNFGDRTVHLEKRNPSPLLDGKFIELMIVTDSTMFDYHGNELESYLKTVMSIAATAFSSPTLRTNISLHIVRCLILETDEVDPVIVRDARTSLRNFCKWQESVYPENVEHPEHFDLAALITRHDLSREDIIKGSADHGVLGLAHLASACVKSRRCAIVEDNGLATGLTVAHEIGHTLGLEHDGARNGCPVSGNIMSSVTSSGPGAYAWSECSVEYLQQFLKWPISHCLNDPPSMNKNLTLFRGWRPGQLFHRDEQCRFLYDTSTGACSHRKTECDKLWCLRFSPDIGNTVCSTNKYPPADGTECGSGKWCIGGNCVGYGEDGPEPIHGGWSEWDAKFSDCSRTCGGGIRQKRRRCNSPVPSFGGQHCEGSDTLLESCNIFDCASSTQYQFARQQCSALDDIPYKGQLTLWEPYTDRSRTSGDDFCKRSCASYGLKKVVKFGRFVDGTRCDFVDPLGDETALGLCVGGRCKRFGCDLVVDSNIRLDHCGVCGGDSATCEVDRGSIIGQIISEERTALDIPSGSTFVNITQYSKQCHLALSIDNQNIFGDDGSRAKSRIYTFGNDVISYVGKEPESIQIRGPINAEYIAIKIYCNSGNSPPSHQPDLHWVYFQPTQERRHHAWRLVTTGCSKTCGFGITTSEVICVEIGASNDTPTDPLNCISLRKPETEVKPCNLFDCPHRWEVGEWGDCSTSCGTSGVRLRSAYCVRENTAGMIELLPHRMCAEREDEPELRETCNEFPCPTGPETSCNRTIARSEGTVKSPGYPSHYPLNVDCEMVITVNPGYWIDLTFTNFDLEPSPRCVFDAVQVFKQESSLGRSPASQRLCGARFVPFSVVVRGRTAVIRFHSDHLITKRGFSAIFEELDP